MDNYPEALWHLANAIDYFHYDLLLPLIYIYCVGLLMFRPYMALSLAFPVIAVQLAWLGCPLRMFCDYLCQSKQPGFDAFETSSAHRFYQHMGWLGPYRFLLCLSLLACSGWWTYRRKWRVTTRWNAVAERLTQEAWKNAIGEQMQCRT